MSRSRSGTGWASIRAPAGRRILRSVPHDLESEAQIRVPGLNAPLRALLGGERHLLRLLDLPLGVSLYCLARKPS